MPPLPRYHDDPQPRRRQSWNPIVTRGMQALGRAAVRYTARRATEYFWPPESPIGPSLTPESGDSLFSQESMSGTKHLRGSSAGGSLSQAKKVAKRINGGSSISNTGVVPAMFQRGRGAEVPGIVANYQAPLKRSGGSGPAPVNAIAQQYKAYKGCKVAENFAFKIIMDPKSYVDLASQTSYTNPSNVTRFVVHNVFRHKNSAANDPNPGQIWAVNAGSTTYTRVPIGADQRLLGWTGMRTGGNGTFSWTNTNITPHVTSTRGCTTDWNYTLGPDTAQVRQVPPVGTFQYAAQPNASEYDTELVTPFRNPQNGTYMYSTLTVQALENIGWNLNPYKSVRPQNTSIGFPGSSVQGYNLYDFMKTLQPPMLYSNAPYSVAKFYPNIPGQSGNRGIIPTDGFNDAFIGKDWCRSFPNLQDVCNQITDKQPADLMSNIAQTGQKNSVSSTYQSQFGPGSVSYTFANNGNCPVCIDVVVHTIKKGKIVDSLNIPVMDQSHQGVMSGTVGVQVNDSLGKTYGCAYIAQQRGQQGGTDLNGRPPNQFDCLYDAKTPFLSPALLKIPQKAIETFGPTHPINPDGYDFGGRPFKQDTRDQFIVAAGAQRSWTFSLPSMNYFSGDYRQGGGPQVLNGTTGIIGTADQQLFNGLHTNQANDSAPPGNDFSICDDLSYIVTVGASAVPMTVAEIPVTAPPAILDRSSGGLNISVTGTYSETPLPVYMKEKRTKWDLTGALQRPTVGSISTKVSRVDVLNLGDAEFTSGTQPYVTAEPLSTAPFA